MHTRKDPSQSSAGLIEEHKKTLILKLNALVNLGKHLGLFSERHLRGGLDGGEIKHVQHMEVEFVKSTRS